jgi:predicted PurR-regulated permease PerM
VAPIGRSIVAIVVGYLILIPVVLFFLLIDWPFYVLRAIALVPPRLRERVASFTSDCDTVLGQYLRGQLLVMLMMAAFYSVGLALFGFDLAVPVGVFTGLAIFVPYVGFGVGLVLALLAGALQFTGWYGPVAVLVVYGIGQVVEGLFLTPRMVGKRIGMSPLTVIFALFAFGHLFGFVGVLIALPASALIAVATARLRASYTQSSLYTG